MASISPNISLSLIEAFFSPNIPFEFLLISTTFDSYILPSLLSTINPVVESIISWPKAPNIFVFGSIKVKVPIPAIVSFK